MLSTLNELIAVAGTLVPAVVDVVVKGTLLLLIACLAAWLARRSSAAMRHFLWTLAVAGLLVLPLLSAVLPAWPVIPDSVSTVETDAFPAPVVPAEQESFVEHRTQPPFEPVAENVSFPIRDRFGFPAPHGNGLEASPTMSGKLTLSATATLANPAVVMLAVWLTGCAIVLTWLVAGVLRAAFLCRRTRSVIDPQLLAGWDKARTELGVRRRVTLSADEAVSMPMTVGVLRPRVLLPSEALHWPADRLRIVLLHELAHVRRRDCLTQLLASLVCAVYWFHPLAWFALHRMRIEAEQASDDLVLSTGARPSDYARQLLAVCLEHAAAIRCPAAVGMARPSRIAGRLQRILNDDHRHRSLTRRSFVLGTCLAVAVVVPLAMATGRAEEPAGTDDAASKRTSQNTGSNSETGVAAKDDSADDNEAQNKALAVHRAAAVLHQQPRLSLRTKVVVSKPAAMQSVGEKSLERLKEALDETALEQDQIFQYEQNWAWDEDHFLRTTETHATDDTGRKTHATQYKFWTRTATWERGQGYDGDVRYVLLASPEMLWGSMLFQSYHYFTVTPRRFWWGYADFSSELGSRIPPERVAYVSLGTEEFGGEPCDVVESLRRKERLWIGKQSGRLRGVLNFYRKGGNDDDQPYYDRDQVQEIAGHTFTSHNAYVNWLVGEASYEQRALLEEYRSEVSDATAIEPARLIRFDDYREVTAGFWLPYHMVWTLAHPNDLDGKTYAYFHNESHLEAVTTDVDLAPRFPSLMPKDGDRIQDQRYGVPVNYEYRADRTKEEILELVAAAKQEREEGQKIFEEMIKPLQAMVGKPAPPLPAEGWLGGELPPLTGQPYLIHFWATWCGPCKNDFPLLNELAKNGTPIIGLHPAGTPAEDVQKAIADEELGYPTFLATDEQDRETIAGYPAKLFPYCVIVDGEGRVAGHGQVGPDLMATFRALKQPGDDQTR